MDSGEDIVISGVAGRLPEFDNVDEFMSALLNGTDFITESVRRYPPGKSLYYHLFFANQ